MKSTYQKPQQKTLCVQTEKFLAASQQLPQSGGEDNIVVGMPYRPNSDGYTRYWEPPFYYEGDE